MDAYDDEHEQQRPRWVPYTPPTPEGWERVWVFFRRLTFPLVVLLFIGGVAGAYYWTTEIGPANESRRAVNVLSGERDQAENTSTRRTTEAIQLSVRSEPSGAAVRLNGDSVGTTPFSDSTLTARMYMLSLRSERHAPVDTVIDLRGGTGASLQFSLRPRPTYAESGSEAPGSVQEPDAAPPEQRVPQSSADSNDPPTQNESPSPQAPSVGALYVTSAPEGALVSVEAQERGRTPIRIENVPTGTKEVALSLDGYVPWDGQVEVVADSTHRVRAELEEQTGRLRVLARPWGTIYINGTVRARESDVWFDTDLSVGRHRVTVVHPVLGDTMRQVEVRPGETTSVELDLQAEEEENP